MTRPFARKLVILIAVGFLCAIGTRPGGRPWLRGDPPARPETTAFLGGEMSDEERVVFTATVAAADHPGVVLFDTPKARPHLARFLREFGSGDVRPVGRFDANSEWSKRSAIEFRNGRPGDLWRALFPRRAVVVCPRLAAAAAGRGSGVRGPRPAVHMAF